MVIYPSYEIRNKYPGPLITYDGEERCEPRLIRFSDLSGKNGNSIIKDCFGTEAENSEESNEESEEEEEEDSNSNEEFNEEAQEHLLQLVKNIFPGGNRKTNGSPQKCCSPEEAPPSDKMNRHDLCAKKLYEICIRNIPNSLPWNCLKPEQKLRFQWKAIVGDDLQETPYGNFRLGFIRNFRKAFPRASSHRLRTEMRLQWCHMERSNRLPFILQALLYHVSTGHLDPQDHCAIRGLFNRFQ
ncbi:hypothetical protein KR009_011370 [Drosophila setifemur]|nr:hypothetical protein KR009_011370 [Drosophila setifemur]